MIASITDRHITSDLAIRTLEKALDSRHPAKGGLILHSDQGSQYTSQAFTKFCESVHVTQSMGKAGYPYDNAPLFMNFGRNRNRTRQWRNSPHYRADSELAPVGNVRR